MPILPIFALSVFIDFLLVLAIPIPYNTYSNLIYVRTKFY